MDTDAEGLVPGSPVTHSVKWSHRFKTPMVASLSALICVHLRFLGLMVGSAPGAQFDVTHAEQIAAIGCEIECSNRSRMGAQQGDLSQLLHVPQPDMAAEIPGGKARA